MEIVTVNGKKFNANEAKISVFDRGFLYGDQCCELIRAYNGKLFKLKRHLTRLENSLAILKISPIDLDALEKQIILLLEESKLTSATVRISVSRGDSSDGFRFTGKLTPNIVIIIKDYQPLPYDFYSHGIAVVFGTIKRVSPESWHLNAKNTNLNNVLANLEAQEAGAYETIMLNSEGYLTEGATSNVFWVKEEELYTPADYLGILPGITREIVLELADKLGLRINQGEYFPEELVEAEESFLTNASIGILPINSVDGKQIHNGSIGHFTSILRESYHSLVTSET